MLNQPKQKQQLINKIIERAENIKVRHNRGLSQMQAAFLNAVTK